MKKITEKQLLDLLSEYPTMSYSDIAKTFNCSKPLIQYWFRKLGIKRDRIAQQKINNTNRNKPITISTGAKSILIGKLLGDAYVTKYNRTGPSVKILNSAISCGHSYLQKEYVLYLQKRLQEEGLLSHYREDQTVVYTKIKDHIAKCNGLSVLTTVKNISFNCWRDLWYPKGKKVIPSEIFEYFTPETLAFWFMDDGTKSGTKVKVYYLHTEGFTVEDILKLRTFLLEKFNIQTNTHFVRNKPVIYIKQTSNKLFTSLVEPYMCESMKYKLIK